MDEEIIEVDTEIFDAISNSIHTPYLKRALSYCLLKYIPGMRLELSRDKYNKTVIATNLEFHSHITDDGDGYIVELHDPQIDPHSEAN